MSDETGAAVEVPPVESTAEAPAPEPTETQPETQEQGSDIERVKGKGKAGAMQNVRKRAERAAERFKAQAEAAKERALNQPREEAGKPEGGQFKADAGDEESPQQSEAVADDAPAELEPPVAEAPGGDSQVDTSAADEVPDGWVDIPLPDGHPLRERGRTHLRALKEQEADIRNGINALDQLHQTELELERTQREAAVLKATREALSGKNLPNLDADPRWKELLEQVEKAEGFGSDMVEQIKAWRMGAEEGAILRAQQDANQQVHIQRTAARIASDIESKAGEVFGVWQKTGEIGHRVPNLIRQYFSAVDQRNEREGTDMAPSVDEFFRWARPAYGSDPRVQSALKELKMKEEERERERIRAEERARLLKDTEAQKADAAKRHAAKPPTSRSLPSSSTPATQPSEEREAPRPGRYRQDAKKRIRERFASP